MSMNIIGPAYTVTFYRIKADDIHTKIPIGSFAAEKSLPYYHSFGHTEDYLIMPHNSMTFDMAGMVEGKPMIKNMKLDYSKKVEFQLMKISDGSYETYKADHAGLIMHSGNSYVDEFGNFIYDAEMFIEAEETPFDIFERSYYTDANRAALKVGSRLRRYKIDMKTKEVSFKDVLSYDSDLVGFVMINPSY
jgi:carotenoid cleavage dioxygenase-like enzyme